MIAPTYHYSLNRKHAFIEHTLVMKDKYSRNKKTERKKKRMNVILVIRIKNKSTPIISDREIFVRWNYDDRRIKIAPVKHHETNDTLHIRNAKYSHVQSNIYIWDSTTSLYSFLMKLYEETVQGLEKKEKKKKDEWGIDVWLINPGTSIYFSICPILEFSIQETVISFSHPCIYLELLEIQNSERDIEQSDNNFLMLIVIGQVSHGKLVSSNSAPSSQI